MTTEVMVTVYAVFFNMEDNVPNVYTLDEEVAKDLVKTRASADYIVLSDVPLSVWMEMFLR